MSDDLAATPAPRPDAVCDGGDLDCGSGLLLIVDRALAPLPAGATLELRSREPHVLDELPVWCEAQGHAIVDVRMTSGPTCYLIRKGTDGAGAGAAPEGTRAVAIRRRGDDWSKAGGPETPAAALDAFLLGLAVCLSDAVRRSGPVRARGVDEVEVALHASPPREDGAPLAIEGEVRVPFPLGEDEAVTIRAEAVTGSPLARALAVPPALSVHGADA